MKNWEWYIHTLTHREIYTHIHTCYILVHIYQINLHMWKPSVTSGLLQNHIYLYIDISLHMYVLQTSLRSWFSEVKTAEFHLYSIRLSLRNPLPTATLFHSASLCPSTCLRNWEKIAINEHSKVVNIKSILCTQRYYELKPY